MSGGVASIDYRGCTRLNLDEAEKFIGDEEANALLKRAERPGHGIFNLLAQQK